ncbi:alpha/beta hydrolase [Pacificimonas sp. WHA3]|uniref:Alpha/beta hydrolase n=1 Tax=Pacificimonas pallii TaxID=2827236 RepID=A0ABS6SAD0_9SPHN|nr:alpha/beta hydrolase [Pacificimonas pallii]
MTSQRRAYANSAKTIIDCDGFEIGVRRWGEKAAPAVVLMHGLGGSSRNFDELAGQLSPHFYCVAPDMIGRGMSAWSAAPDRDYCFDVYERISVALVDQLGLNRLAWLGVSMGGALGMRLSAGALADRITALIVNDVGTQLNSDIADAIFKAMSVDTRFESIAALAGHMKNAFGAFGMRQSGKRTWVDMAINSARRRDDGAWSLHFDPAVAQQLRSHRGDFDLDEAFGALRAPLFLFRGSESNVLDEENAAAMIARHPNAQFNLVEGVGHAPLLDRREDVDAIIHFLSKHCVSRP